MLPQGENTQNIYSCHCISGCASYFCIHTSSMLLVRRGCMEGKSPTTVFGRKTTCQTCRNGKILRFCSGQLTLGIKIKRMSPLNQVAGRRYPFMQKLRVPPRHSILLKANHYIISKVRSMHTYYRCGKVTDTLYKRWRLLFF